MGFTIIASVVEQHRVYEISREAYERSASNLGFFLLYALATNTLHHPILYSSF